MSAETREQTMRRAAAVASAISNCLSLRADGFEDEAMPLAQALEMAEELVGDLQELTEG